MDCDCGKMLVKVPASSANLGSGFDSIGVAVNLYLTIEVEKSTELSFDWQGHLAGLDIRPEDNLILEGMQQVFALQGKSVPPLSLTVKSDIPLTRGLGSSASAYVAGLVIANQYLGNPLTEDELLWLATEKEGHPDNVGPAIFGGVFLASVNWEEKRVIHHRQPFPEEWQLVVAIPSYEVSTKKAREILPSYYSKAESVFNISRFGMLVSSLFTKNKEAFKLGLEDALHQPFRSHLIPGFSQLLAERDELGVFGFVISGAGPTVLAIMDESADIDRVMRRMRETLTIEGHDVDVKRIEVDNQGYAVEHILYNRSGHLD